MIEYMSFSFREEDLGTQGSLYTMDTRDYAIIDNAQFGGLGEPRGKCVRMSKIEPWYKIQALIM